MSHYQQREFVQRLKNKLPQYFRNQKVLEIGILNIYGTIRDFFNEMN